MSTALELIYEAYRLLETQNWIDRDSIRERLSKAIEILGTAETSACTLHDWPDEPSSETAQWRIVMEDGELALIIVDSMSDGELAIYIPGKSRWFTKKTAGSCQFVKLVSGVYVDASLLKIHPADRGPGYELWKQQTGGE